METTMVCKKCGKAYLSSPSPSGLRWCPLCHSEHGTDGEPSVDPQTAKITRKFNK